MIVQILDVLIGLTVVYLIFSTVASTSLELVEAIVRKRGLLLLRGIDEMFRALGNGIAVSATDLDAFLVAFYANPHVSALYGGELQLRVAPPGAAPAPAVAARPSWLQGLRGIDPAKADSRFKVFGGRLPSYIPAERFAAAIQSMAAATSTAAGGTPQPTAAALLCQRIILIASELNLPASAAGITDELERQRHKLAAFYEGSAERISGWYRRRVQWLLLIVGIALAGSLNVDTVRIAKVLSEDPVIRSRLVEQALDEVRDQGLAGFEIAPEACEQPAGTQPQVSAAPAADVAETPAVEPAVPTAASVTQPDVDADATSDAKPDAKSDEKPDDCETELRAGIAQRLRYANALGLPIGWDQDPLTARLRTSDKAWWSLIGACLVKLLGCLMTALAICMGAPFWFDLLNKLANVRTAIKPASADKHDGNSPS